MEAEDIDNSNCRTFGILWNFGCAKDGYQVQCTRRRWLLILSMLFILQCYFNVSLYYNLLQSAGIERLYYFNSWTNTSDEIENKSVVSVYYRYPIIINTTDVVMTYDEAYNTSYYWFTAMKPWFQNLGIQEYPKYTVNTSNCQSNETHFGRILVNKTLPTLEWIAEQNPDVKLGGYYAPAHCRAKYRVAVIVSYRNQTASLAVLLRYVHPLLKKQLLEYRIFVLEQYGNKKFNKGTLYNIAYLESQRFGSWDCLVFHDVDLIPEDERISYSCQQDPTHMSPALEASKYIRPNRTVFGGVTSLTPEQYRTVNGYSNLYWDLDADDDFYSRLQSKNYTVSEYNTTIARYATMPRDDTIIGSKRPPPSKLSVQDGLTFTKYKLINVTKETLYTYILADVNPTNINLDTNLPQQETKLH